MPIKSKAQRRKFAELLMKGEISPQTFEEWNRAAGDAELPERLHPKVVRKPKGKNKPNPRAKPRRKIKPKRKAKPKRSPRTRTARKRRTSGRARK